MHHDSGPARACAWPSGITAGAKGLEDFAILDVSSGVGMGVMSGGRLVRGHSGFAGEIGHITVAPKGRLCGCGNRGCLETVASDTALAWRVSRRLGRQIDIDELIRLVHAGELDPEDDCKDVIRYLAIGLATVINVFNPSTLFIHGQLFDVDEGLFARVLDETSKRALAPSFADCQIIRARGSKRQGAVAGVIQYLDRFDRARIATLKRIAGIRRSVSGVVKQGFQLIEPGLRHASGDLGSRACG